LGILKFLLSHLDAGCQDVEVGRDLTVLQEIPPDFVGQVAVFIFHEVTSSEIIWS